MARSVGRQQHVEVRTLTRQALLAIVVGAVGAFGGFLVSKPDRCPRCKRITEVAKSSLASGRFAPCWLDEMGRPRKS